MEIDINRWLFEIPISDIMEDEYDETIGENPCICCGKNIKNPKYFVHLLNTGNIISSAEPFEESQGFFPIGSSCKNKLPNNFYFKP